MPAGGAGGGISNTADWDALVGRMRELRLNEKCKKKTGLCKLAFVYLTNG